MYICVHTHACTCTEGQCISEEVGHEMNDVMHSP